MTGFMGQRGWLDEALGQSLSPSCFLASLPGGSGTEAGMLNLRCGARCRACGLCRGSQGGLSQERPGEGSSKIPGRVPWG